MLGSFGQRPGIGKRRSAGQHPGAGDDDQRVRLPDEVVALFNGLNGANVSFEELGTAFL